MGDADKTIDLIELDEALTRLGALDAELEGLRREQFNLRMALGSGQSVKNHRFKEIRKDIARIKTVMRERKIAETAE